MAGEKALEAAIKGHTGVMIGFKREKTEDGSYKIGIIEIPIEKVMLLEKRFRMSILMSVEMILQKNI